MVTLIRQRGHSHTTVHVHVRWDLPTHGPHTWTARVPKYRTTVSRIERISAPSPHLTAIAPGIRESSYVAFLGSRSHTRGWVLSMYRTRSSASRRTHACHSWHVIIKFVSPLVPGTLLSLTSLLRLYYTIGARGKQPPGVCSLSCVASGKFTIKLR